MFSFHAMHYVGFWLNLDEVALLLFGYSTRGPEDREITDLG